MKVIDLLNRIANGEDVPKYVKYINFVKNKEDIMMVCKENIIYKLDQLEIHLNDKVEIIEEDKKIKKIDDDAITLGIVRDKIKEIIEVINDKS